MSVRYQTRQMGRVLTFFTSFVGTGVFLVFLSISFGLIDTHGGFLSSFKALTEGEQSASADQIDDAVRADASANGRITKEIFDRVPSLVAAEENIDADAAAKLAAHEALKSALRAQLLDATGEKKIARAHRVNRIKKTARKLKAIILSHQKAPTDQTPRARYPLALDLKVIEGANKTVARLKSVKFDKKVAKQKALARARTVVARVDLGLRGTSHNDELIEPGVVTAYAPQSSTQKEDPFSLVVDKEAEALLNANKSTSAINTLAARNAKAKEMEARARKILNAPETLKAIENERIRTEADAYRAANVAKLRKNPHWWSKLPLPRHVSSAREQKCLAEAIYFEARGEVRLGQVAVAQVVLNRVRNPDYPRTICGVVYQNKHKRRSCQFSFACDGLRNSINQPKAWNIAKQIAASVVRGEGLISEIAESTHYHATYVRPRWARSMKLKRKIGRHIFYKTRNGGWS